LETVLNIFTQVAFSVHQSMLMSLHLQLAVCSVQYVTPPSLMWVARHKRQLSRWVQTVKVSLHMPWTQVRGAESQRHSLLTYARHGVEWSASCSGYFNTQQGAHQHPLNMSDGSQSQSRCLEHRKSPCPYQNPIPAFSTLLPSQNTKYANLVPKMICNPHYVQAGWVNVIPSLPLL